MERILEYMKKNAEREREREIDETVKNARRGKQNVK